MESTQKRRRILSCFWEILFWSVGGFLLAGMIGFASPIGAYVLAVVGAGLAIWVLIGKLKPRHLGRARALGLLWFAFVLPFAAIGSQQMRADERQLEAELAELRDQAPQDYLARVREERGEAFWLNELQQLDPEAFTVEQAQRAGEAARAEAEREDAEFQRRAEQLSERQNRSAGFANGAARVVNTETLGDDLRAEIELIEQDLQRSVDLPTSMSGFGEFLARVERYATFIADIEQTEGDAEDARRLGRLRGEIEAFQSREFPRVRDAFGPMLRRDLWIDDASARTFGPGFRTIEFTSSRYVLNRNIQSDYMQAIDTLALLRFETVIFRTSENGRAVRYTLGVRSPEDSEIVVWRNGLPRRITLSTERPASTELVVVRPGRVGIWTVDCGVPCQIEIATHEDGTVVSIWHYSEGATGERPLGLPIQTSRGLRFPFTDETGRMLGEYLVVSPTGELSVFDRQGMTMRGEGRSNVDRTLFDRRSE